MPRLLPCGQTAWRLAHLYLHGGRQTHSKVCRPINRQLSNKCNPCQISSSIWDSEPGLDFSSLPEPTRRWICWCSRRTLGGGGERLQIRDTIWALYSPRNLRLCPPLVLRALFSLPQTPANVGSAAAWCRHSAWLSPRSSLQPIPALHVQLLNHLESYK